MEAIYVVSPTETSVNLIIEDFENKRLYQACHLFFITSKHSATLAFFHCCHNNVYLVALSEELFQKISGSPVSKFIRTFKEVNYEFAGRKFFFFFFFLLFSFFVSSLMVFLSFVVVESQVFQTDFSMEPPSTFAKLFAPSLAKGRKQELARIGRQASSFFLFWLPHKDRQRD
jgi:hypothetical protein